MILMWHPGALDAIDDSLGELSHFISAENQLSNGEGVMWTTSITISLWRLQDDLESTIYEIEDLLESDEKEKRLNCGQQKLEKPSRRRSKLWGSYNKTSQPPKAPINPFPPESVSDERKNHEHRLSTIRSLSMSLVISGDRMGRFWMGSIISEIFDEAQVKEYSDEIKELLQMFIHQQYTGRVLAFLLLLGHMCESLSKECNNFAEEVNDIMGLDVSNLSMACLGPQLISFSP